MPVFIEAIMPFGGTTRGMLCHKEAIGQKMKKEALALAFCFASYISGCILMLGGCAVAITAATACGQQGRTGAGQDGDMAAGSSRHGSGGAAAVQQGRRLSGRHCAVAGRVSFLPASVTRPVPSCSSLSAPWTNKLRGSEHPCPDLADDPRPLLPVFIEVVMPFGGRSVICRSVSGVVLCAVS